MLSRSTFWHKTGSWLQLLTGLIHGTSVFSTPHPSNETEKQLIELMRTYFMNFGAGFHRSMEQVFTSISVFMTLSLIYAAAINFVLLRAELSDKTRGHILVVNALYSLAGAVVFYFLAFLHPFLCLLLITVAFFVAYLLHLKHSQRT